MTFDPHDPRQVTGLLVFLDYNPERICDALTHRFGFAEQDARDLVAEFLLLRIDNKELLEKQEQSRAAAIAAEFDLDKTMHGGTE